MVALILSKNNVVTLACRKDSEVNQTPSVKDKLNTYAYALILAVQHNSAADQQLATELSMNLSDSFKHFQYNNIYSILQKVNILLETTDAASLECGDEDLERLRLFIKNNLHAMDNLIQADRVLCLSSALVPTLFVAAVITLFTAPYIVPIMLLVSMVIASYGLGARASTLLENSKQKLLTPVDVDVEPEATVRDRFFQPSFRKALNQIVEDQRSEVEKQFITADNSSCCDSSGYSEEDEESRRMRIYNQNFVQGEGNRYR